MAKKKKRKVSRNKLSQAFNAALAFPPGVQDSITKEYNAKDEALDPKSPMSNPKVLTKYYS